MWESELRLRQLKKHLPPKIWPSHTAKILSSYELLQFIQHCFNVNQKYWWLTSNRPQAVGIRYGLTDSLERSMQLEQINETVRIKNYISSLNPSHSHLSIHFVWLSELFVLSEEKFLCLYPGVHWVFLLSVHICSITVLQPQGPFSLPFLPVLCHCKEEASSNSIWVWSVCFRGKKRSV